MNKEDIAATNAETQNMIMGVFPGISATSGAKIVRNLAKMLLIPIAVDPRMGGNKTVVAI